MEAKPTVIIYDFGGTITAVADCSSEMRKYTCGALPVETLLLQVPVQSMANFEIKEMFKAGSPDITSALKLRALQTIQTDIKRKDIYSVIFLYGTDAVSGFLSTVAYTIASPKAVVAAVATRPFTTMGSDGPWNLLSAVKIAISKQARNRGPLLASHGNIYAGLHVIKNYASALDPFSSDKVGPVGHTFGDSPFFYYDSNRPRGSYFFDVSSFKFLPRVEILYADPDDKGDGFVKRIKLGTRGIVLAGPGGSWLTESGNVIMHTMRELGNLVVVASFDGASAYVQDGAIYGIGTEVIASRIKSPAQCHALLQLCLAWELQESVIRRLFAGTIDDGEWGKQMADMVAMNNQGHWRGRLRQRMDGKRPDVI